MFVGTLFTANYFSMCEYAYVHTYGEFKAVICSSELSSCEKLYMRKLSEDSLARVPFDITRELIQDMLLTKFQSASSINTAITNIIFPRIIYFCIICINKIGNII